LWTWTAISIVRRFKCASRFMFTNHEL